MSYYHGCSMCHSPDAKFRPIKDELDPDWYCDGCVQALLDRLAGWLVEHDRLVAKGVPEKDVEKIIAQLIAQGARPPPVGRC